MYETPETGYHIANCDYCGEEFAGYFGWAQFSQELIKNGWQIIRATERGQVVTHLCPACVAEGLKCEQ